MKAEEGDFLRPIVRTVIQEFLEAEMAEALHRFDVSGHAGTNHHD